MNVNISLLLENHLSVETVTLPFTSIKGQLASYGGIYNRMPLPLSCQVTIAVTLFPKSTLACSVDQHKCTLHTGGCIELKHFPTFAEYFRMRRLYV